MLLHRSALHLSLVLCIVLFSAKAFANDDLDGSKDHSLFSRMPGFYIMDYTAGFDSVDFPVPGPNEDEPGVRTVEGEVTRITYELKEGARLVAPLQILRNYENALKKLGGEVFYRYDKFTMAGKAPKDGRTVYLLIDVRNDGQTYELTALVVSDMAQEVALGSLEMYEKLEQDGRLALYINFDTGKSTIKPESRTIVDEIAKMMQENAGLKIKVEGHTDNQGGAESNQKLSEARAKAVVEAILAKGISASRLKPAGHGQTKPIADNKNEEGRAKNRRVELVKM
ncbi:OmpA/MotB domain protein [Desulfocurvibacter africanus subsp. africanus str. Walvis Bay]|uniref:OmpA/MotB domain protein n=1 Tax=Desulfocurvibacter africanus subsp. africanus str. Walvis Bay TaxID=690850 RepID=F3YTQ1_DESAF|nr:OmpA/MotB domain protein [Desulfocurvibacter africanus subsp. africanus str. Walvis Bay]